MSDDFRIRPRKKRVGAYFNDGHSSSFIQADSDDPRADDDMLVMAVRAAKRAFFEVYGDGRRLKDAGAQSGQRPQRRDG